MDIEVDYYDSTSVAQKLKLIRGRYLETEHGYKTTCNQGRIKATPVRFRKRIRFVNLKLGLYRGRYV